jgi:TonB family protein
MFFNVFLKRIFAFCFAATCGFASFYLLNQFGLFIQSPESEVVYAPSTQRQVRYTGTGSASDTWPGSIDSFEVSRPPTKATKAVFIFSKPRATYTDVARENNVEGTVLLKVTLLASGRVGSITPVRELPFGLTEQAIAAARQIKFKPKTVNGIPVSTIVTIEYGFRIY